MSTNFYWKELPKELQQYENSIVKNIVTNEKEMNPLWHIGKRSAAGKYCIDCGTTFCINGTSRIHYDDNPYELFSKKYNEAQKYYWYSKCPICGKEGQNICSFTWTFMKQKDIIKDLINISKKLILNEYGEEFTPREFWLQEFNNCVVEYQSCCEFS